MMEIKRLRVFLISRRVSVSRRLGVRFLLFFMPPPPFFVLNRPYCSKSAPYCAVLPCLPLDLFHGHGILVAHDPVHPAVFHVDHLVGHGCNGGVVGDDHHRHPLLAAGVLKEL